jgi:hypothetical protein
VFWSDDIADYEPPARPENRSNPAEEIGFLARIEVMHGERGEDEIEGSFGQALLQARDAEVYPGGKLAPRLLQHRVALVDPDERNPWMMLEDAPRGLPRPRTEFENPVSGDAARRLGDRVLELVETLDVRPDRLEVAVGTEVELAQRSSPGSSEWSSIRADRSPNESGPKS